MNNINTSFSSVGSPDVREEADPGVQTARVLRNNSQQAFAITMQNAPMLTPRNLGANIDNEYASVQNFNEHGTLDGQKRLGPLSAIDDSKVGLASEKLNSQQQSLRGDLRNVYEAESTTSLLSHVFGDVYHYRS